MSPHRDWSEIHHHRVAELEEEVARLKEIIAQPTKVESHPTNEHLRKIIKEREARIAILELTLKNRDSPGFWMRLHQAAEREGFYGVALVFVAFGAFVAAAFIIGKLVWRLFLWL